ncbi:MAG TPA: DUF488 family protein [Xanthobacteraceae bacterium]|nr:DUF488 family protein [Xanthobacteraceae bacterium]
MRKSRPAGKRTNKPRSRRARTSSIAIKRAYDPPAPQDGLRILIDRLWPRGLSKTKLKLDAWPRELTPSTALRKWYGHKPERFAEFRRRYLTELAQQRDRLDDLRAMVKGRSATLITATRELQLSHAEVLRGLLQRKKG